MGSRLGQHFLIRGSILKRIAEAACPDRPPLVIEIGPGKGALTGHLLQRADRVIAIEVDPFLVHYLREKFRDRPGFTVIEADILKADLTQWGPAVIAGNLPYYITSPILDRVFSIGAAWSSSVFLVQQEVAERLTASPGSRRYGYLTVQTRVHSSPEMLFAVPRAAFQPPPKVESVVVRLTPRASGFPDPERFLQFASLCFRQKRKTLRNNLIAAYDKSLVDSLPEARLRAEQLDLDRLLALYRKLAGSPG